MDKVRREYFILSGFRFFYFVFIGKFFCNSGSRYEGEYKDGKRHGQGKKSDFIE